MAEEMKKTAEVKTTPQKQTVSKVKEAKKTKNKKMRTYHVYDTMDCWFYSIYIVPIILYSIFEFYKRKDNSTWI